MERKMGLFSARAFRRPPRPRDTSPPDYGRAAEDRDSSLVPVDWYAVEDLSISSYQQRTETWPLMFRGQLSDKWETAGTQAGGPKQENALESIRRIRVALYTQRPFVAQGLAAVFLTHGDLELTACHDSLSGDS